MFGALEGLALLPWKSIATAVAGAAIAGVIATPWFGWKNARQEVKLAEVVVEQAVEEREDMKQSLETAIKNRERVESAMDRMSEATLKLAAESTALAQVTAAAGAHAANLAAATEALATIHVQSEELRHQAEGLDACQTCEMVLHAIGAGL